MKRINVHDAKTNLSRYLERVEKGETLLLCRRNEPIAEIRPLPKRTPDPRPIGLAKGDFEVPPEFFEPLPERVIADFESSAE